MTRDSLLSVARTRGMKGYSKLRRGELLAAVERELYGEEKEKVEKVEGEEEEEEEEGEGRRRRWPWSQSE
jgi:hypothetical protein